MSDIVQLFNGFRPPQTFREQYQDKRWTARSRAIVSKIGYCQECRRSDVRLEAHHYSYDSRPLWERDDAELRVVCDLCHKELTEVIRTFRSQVMPRLSLKAFRVLNAALMVGVKFNDPLVIAHALAGIVTKPSLAESLARGFNED